jgi:spore coat protein SA
MKKRILVVSPGVLPLPPVLGGAVENMIWRLDQHLKEQFDLEYVSVSMGDETNSSVDSSRIHYIQSINPLKDFSKENNFELMESSKWIEYEQFVSALVASGNYDVVHVHNEAGLTSAIYRSSPNTKIILHINDEVMSKMSRKQLREIAEVQPLVLACSRLVEANISATFHHAHVPMPAHDLFYNFVDPDEFNPGRFSQQERIEYLENLGLDPKKITVLFAGRLIEQKGAHLALDAFSKAGEELQMLFVGAPWYSRKADSSYCSRLESQCEQFNGKVKFTGYVNHTDMPKIYSLADIFLAPSIWDDPSPFVTYEQSQEYRHEIRQSPEAPSLVL